MKRVAGCSSILLVIILSTGCGVAGSISGGLLLSDVAGEVRWHYPWVEQLTIQIEPKPSDHSSKGILVLLRPDEEYGPGVSHLVF